MAYIGYNPSQLAIAPFATKYFTGDGTTTTFTLDQSVPGANEANVEVFVENVQQNPVDAYTIGGALNNQLIFSEAPVTGGVIYVIHKGEATYNLQPATGSVTANTLDPVLRNFTVDKFTGDGTTKTFTLTDTPYSPNSVLVVVDGITQTSGTNYNVTGNTLTFDVAPTASPDNGSNVTVVHLGFSSGNKAVMDASITPVKLSLGAPSWDTTGNLRVPLGGILTAGDAASTNGSVIIQGFYGAGVLSVVGSERSSGGLFLGYGVRPGTSQGIPLSSTSITIPRSSIVMDSNVIKFNRAASQLTAIGSPVTMTESLRINESGYVGIGTGTLSEVVTISNANYQALGLYRDLDYNVVGAMGTQINLGGYVGSSRVIAAQYNATLMTATSGVAIINALNGGSQSTIARFNGNGIIDLPYGQIKFPVAQNASSDANTLDDYEEGTFTPAFTSGTYTYATRSGYYRKVGSTVTVWFSIIWNNVTGGPVSMSVSGLPYTSIGSTFRATGAVGYTRGVTFPAGGYTGASWLISEAYNTMDLGFWGSNLTSVFGSITVANVGEVQGTISYLAVS